MDEFLKTAIDRMRSERCPDYVLQKVNQQVAGDLQRTARKNLVRLRLVVATLILLMGAAFYFLQPGPSRDAVVAQLENPGTSPDRTTHEIYASLASIGLVLQEAGNRSGTIILQETLPLLRQGLETAKNAIRLKDQQ